MQVRAERGDWPRVMQVVANSLAEKEGVRVGDAVVEVAGMEVDGRTWFSTMQQASAPYGVKFRRPIDGHRPL
eukprot:NODE_4715_length_647_cov_145.548986.p4 GENE.NODE_4715_length_647_cov_145.548986~~NODE_4715_length_647_cov_145.548986.p4  ORF type:complete len:72 (-),score=21.08 NODE_4715_length_647_cov_145.548986:170-385(-)